ncbi:MAG: zinc-ribbon domain-containing protein, partial [Proteobacteria bacterium]|nr:zinc-ribbon domain-containing protein [Pseudomonadota bacterium]
MIVTCPNCSTRYQLDAQFLVPQGRALRCVKCGHSWTERPKTAAAPVIVETDTDDVEVPDFGLDVPTR